MFDIRIISQSNFVIHPYFLNWFLFFKSDINNFIFTVYEGCTGNKYESYLDPWILDEKGIFENKWSPAKKYWILMIQSFTQECKKAPWKKPESFLQN